MNFLSSGFFLLIWYVITLLIFAGIMMVILKSAAASWKKSGWKGILDECVEAVLLIVVFAIFVQIDPADIVNFLNGPVKYIFAKILELIRSWTGIPL